MGQVRSRVLHNEAEIVRIHLNIMLKIFCDVIYLFKDDSVTDEERNTRSSKYITYQSFCDNIYSPKIGMILLLTQKYIVCRHTHKL